MVYFILDGLWVVQYKIYLYHVFMMHFVLYGLWIVHPYIQGSFIGQIVGFLLLYNVYIYVVDSLRNLKEHSCKSVKEKTREMMKSYKGLFLKKLYWHINEIKSWLFVICWILLWYIYIMHFFLILALHFMFTSRVFGL